MRRAKFLLEEPEVSHHLGLSPACRNPSVDDQILSSNESGRIARKEQSNLSGNSDLSLSREISTSGLPVIRSQSASTSRQVCQSHTAQAWLRQVTSLLGSKSVRTVHSFVPKTRAAIAFATLPRIWLTIQRAAPGRSFLLSTSAIASHECVSLMWVAMYHVFPNASSTAALRSPYGWSAGS